MPRSVRTLAFFKSAPTPPVSRVDDRILPGDGAGEIELRRPDREPDCVESPRFAEAVRRARGVDQRLRGDAADIEAGSAQPVAFDQDRVEAKLAGADRGDIAARAAADDENLAAKLVHVLAPKAELPSPAGCHPREKRGSRRGSIPAFAGMTLSTGQSSMNSVAGASISARTRWMKVAAS